MSTDSTILDRLYTRLHGWAHYLCTLFVELPVILRVLLIYGLSRLWGVAVFSMVGRQQLWGPWGERLGYLELISTWDSGWYWQIADRGYPVELPQDMSGTVMQNQWAFYPLFPLTSGYISRTTGLEYYAVASTVALLAGFIAAWIVYKLCIASLQALGRTDAAENTSLGCWAVAVFAFLPVAPVLQAPYAESVNLIFLAWALYLMVRARYLLLLPVAALACLSRPVGVPLGAAAGLWWFICLITDMRADARRRADEETPRGFWRIFASRAVQLCSALMVCACALIWPAIAWAVTGRVDAYTATETAWRSSHLALFEPWLKQGSIYFGVFSIPLLVLLVVVFALVLLSPAVRGVLSGPLILWCACYAAYLLIFLNPQSSTFRLLLPLFPLVLPMVAVSASRAYRWLLVLSGATLQLVWVGWLWHWKQNPGGGDYPP